MKSHKKDEEGKEKIRGNIVYYVNGYDNEEMKPTKKIKKKKKHKERENGNTSDHVKDAIDPVISRMGEDGLHQACSRVINNNKLKKKKRKAEKLKSSIEVEQESVTTADGGNEMMEDDKVQIAKQEDKILHRHGATMNNEEKLDTLHTACDELTSLEEELQKRFQNCQEYQKEIEDAEKYLDRRQAMVNSKESDLIQLDEELDNLQRELEMNKTQLSNSGVNTDNVMPASQRQRLLEFTSQDEDYILKANIRKLQGDLKTAEQTIMERTAELENVKQELLELQLDRRKKEQKIKHLETQLEVTIGQLNHRHSTVDISGNSSMSFSGRSHAVRQHATLDRMNSTAELSINQIAQINRNRRLTVSDISNKTESTIVKSGDTEISSVSIQRKNASSTCTIV
ncbi:uncharacterized protein LOC102808950 [Saccoglossus kowalevskii]|uniref:Coiled-coil domain-containing protein 18-like n=1 Tax=Saccoglossus kowalevskii TaxID=10224 RepID=A0ABM0M2Q2_SACKO|nr:PREDICTED: coiled-coil domain-containing protein 18-like [Saccoglossus kowalevskii]